MQMVYRGFLIHIRTKKGDIWMNAINLSTGNRLFAETTGFSTEENAIEVAKSGIDRILNKHNNIENGR